MPLRYKLPAYGGNTVLLLLAGVIMSGDSAVVGLLLGALAVLNLFLVYRLDQFSREDVWLAHEVRAAEMRQHLLETQARIGALEAEAAARDPGRGIPSGL